MWDIKCFFSLLYLYQKPTFTNLIVFSHNKCKTYLGNMTWLKRLSNNSSKNTVLSIAGMYQLRKTFNWASEPSHFAPPPPLCPLPAQCLEDREGTHSFQGSVTTTHGPHSLQLSPNGLWVFLLHPSLIILWVCSKLFSIVSCKLWNLYDVCCYKMRLFSLNINLLGPTNVTPCVFKYVLEACRM